MQANMECEEFFSSKGGGLLDQELMDECEGESVKENNARLLKI